MNQVEIELLDSNDDLYIISDEIPPNSKILEKDEDIFDSLSLGGSEGQTYLMNIPEDIEEFLMQQTDHLRKVELRKCNFRFKYLESVIKCIFKDSMQLKFVSQILQCNNEKSFAINETTYTLHRMSNSGSKFEILYEVQEKTQDAHIVLESLCISQNIKFSVQNETFSDTETTPMLHIQFKGSESTLEKCSVLKHFVLLAVRAICENLQLFPMLNREEDEKANGNSLILEILVPQKWWNANEMDNFAWKQETISTINHLITNHNSSDLNKKEKDALTMIQMVPKSVQYLIKYLEENEKCLDESNISFVICSSNKIDIFLKKE